jgi:hypothetical protein
MKKLKAKLAKAKSKISIQTYKKPLLFVILTMVFINFSILAVAAFIAVLIDESFTNFFHAFASGSLTWMLTPNSILVIESPQTRLLAVIIFITGLILFSGTIIALTTNAIKDYFGKKNAGLGKIHLDQHIVILNWNNKVPELVSDLLFVDEEEISVVILAEIDKHQAERQIVNAIKKTNSNKNIISKLNVLVRPGDPLIRADLDDISIEKAKTILMMNPDHHDIVLKNMSKSDLQVIKVVLALGNIAFETNPPIVVEIKHFETKAKIMTLSKVVEPLKNRTILPICFDKRLGQIIAQTIIEHQMEDVYLSLFSFQGSEIYQLKNQSIDSCLKNYSYAIPIAARHQDLFVLSLSDQTKNYTSNHTFKPIKLQTKKVKNKDDLNIYIIGKNNKLSFIMESFDAYQRLQRRHFKAEWIEENDIIKLTQKLNASNERATILLLSDEHQSECSLDANVIDHLIYLEGHITNKKTSIIVELLEPKNDAIVKDFNIENTIISNKIISLLLSKVALYEETAPFYENLLTIGSTDSGYDRQSIQIEYAKDIFETKFPLHFESKKQLVESIYLSLNETLMPIGLFRDQQLIIFEGDLHQTETISILENDRLVFVLL